MFNSTMEFESVIFYELCILRFSATGDKISERIGKLILSMEKYYAKQK